MRILQINPIVGYSSTGRTTSELDRYFWEHGHEDYVACFSGYDVRKMYQIGNSLDRKCHALLNRLTGYEASFSYFPTRHLISYIRELLPDVVKLGVAHSNYLNVFKLLHFLGTEDIPTVVVLNDCWYFTGKCMHYTTNQCFKWKTGCGKCPHLSNGLPTLFFDRTARMLEKKRKAFQEVPRLAVIGVSDWLVNEARQSILKDATILRRIYNWVDLKQFYPHDDQPETLIDAHLEGKKVVLGVASSWKSGKGLENFLQLAHDVDEDTYIVLVGGMPQDIEFPLNVVHIPETRNIKELARLYSRADVFVTFSLEETFGKVSAEALACGTPVVCFDSTASPEIVGEKGGRVVPAGNYAAVREAVKDILTQGKGTYSEECVQQTRQNFCYETNAQEYLKLFEELVQGKGRLK